MWMRINLVYEWRNPEVGSDRYAPLYMMVQGGIEILEWLEGDFIGFLTLRIDFMMSYL